MKKDEISNFIGDISMSIVDAMERIDSNSCGIIFLVDDERILKGCISDGDIRRWLIKTGDLNANVNRAMISNPCYINIQEKAKANEILRNKLMTAIPLVNEKKQIVDICLLKDSLKKREKKGSLKGVSVVIMAGGKGTRLYPYTKILPKPLIPIGETPIIERIIQCFTDYEIDQFYVTVNYKKGMIKSYFSDVKMDYSLNFVEEKKPLGTGGSIKLIEKEFNSPLFVTNCDTLIFTNYKDLFEYHIKSNNAITIVSAMKKIVLPYGVLHIKGNGEIDNMVEKPKQSYLINTGMYVINPELIDLIPDDTMFHMTDLIEKVLERNGKVGTYPISEDSFLDMGEISEMRRMEEKLNIVSE